MNYYQQLDPIPDPSNFEKFIGHIIVKHYKM